MRIRFASCFGKNAQEIYNGKLTYTINDCSKTVSITNSQHFTFAYDHMLLAQSQNQNAVMTIQFEGTFKGQKKTTINYDSLEAFHTDLNTQSLISHSQLRFRKQ